MDKFKHFQGPVSVLFSKTFQGLEVFFRLTSFQGPVGTLYVCVCMYVYIQWGKKVFSQPPIVQVLPLKKMREACNFHHRYTSTIRGKIRKKKYRKSHCRIFKEFICKLWWKISIWSITNTVSCVRYFVLELQLTIIFIVY